MNKNRFLWSCLHEWEVMEKFDLAAKNPNQIGGVVYVMKCKHCGNLKQKRIW